MCLNPRRIQSRSGYFNLRSFHKLSMDVPCGECAECQAARQNEYYFRSYYQCLDCWNHGGYVLFDTLTYDDAHLPHISDFIDVDCPYLDFPCFSTEDIRDFQVRLRRHLDYRLKLNKDSYKMFVASEYGDDNRYTHRPHYHILVYVYDNRIEPQMLSEAIDACWQNGRTDGAPYNGTAYVLQNRVYRGDDENAVRAVCVYLSDYLVKDSNFASEIKRRLSLLLKYMHEKQFSELYGNVLNYDAAFVRKHLRERLTDENKKMLTSLRRHVKQFNKQSQGFGKYMIESLGEDWIMEHNCVRMPDFETGWREIPIPKYIQQKMFYEKKYDVNTGEQYLGLSDKGIEYKMMHMDEVVKQGVSRYSDFFREENLSQYFTPFQVEDIKLHVDKYLDGRTWSDFVEYIMFYRGRIIEFADGEDLDSFDVRSYSLLDQRQVDFSEFVNSDDSDLSPYVINQRFHRFRNFDYLDTYYHELSRHIAQYKQEKFDETRALRKKVKEFRNSLKR